MSSLLFWLLVGLMTLTAVGFLLLPLWRNRSISEVSRRDVNVALYRERLQELEQAGTVVGVEDADAARQELEARLVADAAESDAAMARPGFPRATAVLLLLLLPALAVGTYLYNSDWRMALAGKGPEAIGLLLERLEQHLAQEPGDAAGWQLLARSKMQLREFEPAADAFARANALAPTPDNLVGEAEARAMMAGGSLQGRPDALIKRALELDPDSIRAQWYAGMVAWQRGDAKTSLEYWEHVARQDIPDDFRELLQAQIEQAGGTPPAAPEHFGIPVQVALDPKLATQVSSDMPVFIYARAQGQGGPPLAAVRRTVADLPLTVTLDDSQSMIPDRKLSSVDSWTIQARIALQGSAERRSGDLYAEQAVTRHQQDHPVSLVISRTVP